MKPTIELPKYLSDLLNTVAGTIYVKRLLTALFTVFFQSSMWDALAPDERDNLIQLQSDLHALVDKLFAERINQKATTAGALQTTKRSTPK